MRSPTNTKKDQQALLAQMILEMLINQKVTKESVQEEEPSPDKKEFSNNILKQEINGEETSSKIRDKQAMDLILEAFLTRRELTQEQKCVEKLETPLLNHQEEFVAMDTAGPPGVK